MIWDIHNTMISYYIIAFCSYYAYRIWDVSYYIVIPKMYQENIRVDAYDIWFRVGRLQKNISQWYTHMGYRNTSMILLDYYIMIYIYEYIYMIYQDIYFWVLFRHMDFLYYYCNVSSTCWDYTIGRSTSSFRIPTGWCIISTTKSPANH